MTNVKSEIEVRIGPDEWHEVLERHATRWVKPYLRSESARVDNSFLEEGHNSDYIVRISVSVDDSEDGK